MRRSSSFMFLLAATLAVFFLSVASQPSISGDLNVPVALVNGVSLTTFDADGRAAPFESSASESFQQDNVQPQLAGESFDNNAFSAALDLHAVGVNFPSLMSVVRELSIATRKKVARLRRELSSTQRLLRDAIKELSNFERRLRILLRTEQSASRRYSAYARCERRESRDCRQHRRGSRRSGKGGGCSRRKLERLCGDGYELKRDLDRATAQRRRTTRNLERQLDHVESLQKEERSLKKEIEKCIRDGGVKPSVEPRVPNNKDRKRNKRPRKNRRNKRW